MVVDVFRLGAALLVLLTVVESVGGKKLAFLPLGGSHITQTGVVLGVAFVVMEIALMVLHQ